MNKPIACVCVVVAIQAVVHVTRVKGDEHISKGRYVCSLVRVCCFSRPSSGCVVSVMARGYRSLANDSSWIAKHIFPLTVNLALANRDAGVSFHMRIV